MDEIQGQEGPSSDPSVGENAADSDASAAPEAGASGEAEKKPVPYERFSEVVHARRDAERERDYLRDQLDRERQALQAERERLRQQPDRRTEEAPPIQDVKRFFPNADDETAAGFAKWVDSIAERRASKAAEEARRESRGVARQAVMDRLTAEFPEFRPGTELWKRTEDRVKAFAEPDSLDAPRMGQLYRMALEAESKSLSRSQRERESGVKSEEQRKLGGPEPKASAQEGLPAKISLSWIREIQSRGRAVYEKYEPAIRKALDSGNFIAD